MNNIMKLDKLMDWGVANYPLSRENKARLMALSDDDFIAELDQMEKDYHKNRYGGF